MKHLLTLFVIFTSFLGFSQADANITTPDATICACDNAVLSSATSVPGNSPIVRTIWSVVGCGVNIADTTLPGQNLILPLCVTCSYDISIINQHQNGTTSVAQEPAFITVNANPVAGINASVNSCQVPFGVQYSPVGNGTGITAAWTFESGNPGTFNGDTPPVINYNVAGSYDVQLILTNTLTGCKDTAFQTMNVSNFDAGITLPTGPLCEGDALQFTDNSTVGANSWNWTFENGSPASSGAQNPTASFPPGTHDITLFSSNTSIGCNGSVTVQITVLAKPTPTFTVNPTTGCAPLDVDFVNTNIQAGATYAWDFDGNGSIDFNGSVPPLNYTIVGNGSYTPTLTMTGSNGCVATVSGTPIVLTSPVACFSQVENSLCEPKNVSFDPACSTAPGPITSYVWIFGDGSPNQTTFNANPVSHDYMCGKYTPSLVINMANGCTDTVSGGEIKVGTPLNINFTADTLLQCIKTPIKLTSLTPIDCPHDQSDLIYNWIFNNVPSPGDSVYMKQFMDTNQNINYAVDVALQIDFRGCKSSDTIVDYIYIKAPVSAFQLDNLLFCDTPEGVNGSLGKVVTVNDLNSVYHHANPVTHSLVPPLGSNLVTVPDSTSDAVVTCTYKWGDGTPNTVFTDVDIEDADKGATTHTYNSYGTYEVWQIIHNEGTGCYDSTNFTVNVSWIETDYDFDIAGPDSVCISSPFTFTSTSGTHGVPNVEPDTHAPLSYSFDMVSGGTVTGSGSTVNQNFTHTYFTPGVYDVVLTTTNSVGCSTTATDQITAFALPSASFTLDQTAGCVGIQYTSTATNTSTHPAGSFGFGNDNTGWASNDAFQWTVTPNGGTTTNPTTDARNETISTPVNNTTTVSLVVTDGFGCVSPIFSLTANVQQPNADIAVASGVCHGDAVVAQSTSSGSNLTYQWYFNSGLDGTPDGTNPTFAQVLTSAGLSQTYSYQLIVVDDLGCPDTSAVYTTTVSKPVAGFTDIKSGSATDEFGNFVCPPVVVNFTDNSQSVGNIVSHAWFLALTPSQQGNPFSPPGVTTTQTNPQGMQYLFPGTYDLAYIIQDEFGCIDTAYVADYLVIEGPSGDPSIVENTSVCGQDFTFNLTNTQNVAGWTWNLGDGTVVSSSEEPDNTFIHTYPGVQTYTPVITLVDAVGCAVPYPLSVTIDPNGVDALFDFSPNEINLGTAVFFDDASSSVGGNVSTWIWNFGDGTIDTLTNGNTFAHQYIIGGDDIPVLLTVVDDRGCTDQYLVHLKIDVNFDMPNVLTGNESGGLNADLLLFADVFKDFDITIVNRWGNVVYEGTRDPAKPRYLWNGVDQKSDKLCNDGTYYYILKGTLLNDKEIDIHGFVTLIGSRTKL